jgi:hypothetical protein
LISDPLSSGSRQTSDQARNDGSVKNGTLASSATKTNYPGVEQW